MNGHQAHSDHHRTYWIVAKFSSESAVSAGDVESQVRKALLGLRKGIKVEIVQLGYT